MKMKMLKVAVATVCMVAFGQVSKAQFSAGVNAALPMGTVGDVISLGFGVNLGYDYALDDKMSVGGEAGYTYFPTKDPDFIDDKYADGTKHYDSYSRSYSMIPILANFKYYFADNTNGLYGLASLGVTSLIYKENYTRNEQKVDWNINTGWTYSYEKKSYENSFSGTYFTFGAGLGYIINEKIDLGVRYLTVSSNGGSASFMNLRVAYNF